MDMLELNCFSDSWLGVFMPETTSIVDLTIVVTFGIKTSADIFDRNSEMVEQELLEHGFMVPIDSHVEFV